MRILVLVVVLVCGNSSAGVFRVGTWNMAHAENGGVLRMQIAHVVPRCLPMPDDPVAPAPDQCKAIIASGWPYCAQSSAPDILLLQDVDQHRARSGCGNQPEMMRSALSMSKGAYAPRPTEWEPSCPPQNFGSTGIVALSGPRMPSKKEKVFSLPQGNGCCPVDMIATYHDFEGKRIGMYSTHLSHSSYVYPERGPARKGQVDAAMNIIAADAPLEGVDLVLFGGDLNAPATEPEFDSLRVNGFTNAMIDPTPIAQVWFKLLGSLPWFSFSPEIANACAVSDHDYRVVTFAFFPEAWANGEPLPSWWWYANPSVPYPVIRGTSRVGSEPTFDNYRWCADPKLNGEGCYPFWCDSSLSSCG